MLKKVLIPLSIALAATAIAADRSSDEAAIEKLLAQIDTCIAKGDSKCLTDLVTDDATMSGPLDGRKILAGKAAIKRAMDGVLKDSYTAKVKQTRTVDRIRFLGDDYAVVDFSIKQGGDLGSSDGKAVRQNWKSISVVKREGDNWLIQDGRYYVIETLIPPTPAPSPAPTKPEKDQASEPDSEKPAAP